MLGDEQDSGPAGRRVLRALRDGPKTVAQIAAILGLTRNGVRVHLDTLERTGLIRRSGVIHRASTGKPPLVYQVTDAGDVALSNAYAPMLAALVDRVASTVSPEALHDEFTAVGIKLAASWIDAAPTGDATQRATAVLESLGARVKVGWDADGVPVVSGDGCPLSVVVAGCHDGCEMVRSLLAHRAGAPVTTRCEYVDGPRCRFAIGATSSTE
jgi:predicted ArsR family transcriptional regulator